MKKNTTDSSDEIENTTLRNGEDSLEPNNLQPPLTDSPYRALLLTVRSILGLTDWDIHLKQDGYPTDGVNHIHEVRWYTEYIPQRLTAIIHVQQSLTPTQLTMIICTALSELASRSLLDTAKLLISAGHENEDALFELLDREHAQWSIRIGRAIATLFESKED